MPVGRDKLIELLGEYRGFGMFSLIRSLLFRGWRHAGLALISLLLLVGQWAGPLGFIAFKLRMLDHDDCPADARLWARFVITSVALIYTARLTVYSLSHTLDVPEEFNSFKMPKWWTIYRKLDLVVESLLYDTTIFMFNLFIVFQDRSVGDMIVDVLALEFFTMIDDEFKVALLKFDSSFLEDMVIEAVVDGCYVGSESTLEDGGGRGVRGVGGAADDYAGGKKDEMRDGGTRSSAVHKFVVVPLEAALHVIRTFCRVIGPAFSSVMIVYGPYCLGMPEE
eukprot:g6391.t1